MQTITFEIVPHPRSRGDWMLKPNRGAPYGLWYRDRARAVSYAENGLRGRWTRLKYGCSTATAPFSSAVISERASTRERNNEKTRPRAKPVTFEQLSYSNMLTLNALVELLTEKGVLTKPEILARVKKFQSETKVSA